MAPRTPAVSPMAVIFNPRRSYGSLCLVASIPRSPCGRTETLLSAHRHHRLDGGVTLHYKGLCANSWTSAVRGEFLGHGSAFDDVDGSSPYG